MAAQVQLNVIVNEGQVRQQINNIQQQINNLVAHPYTIQLNAQFSPAGFQQLNQILNVTNQLQSNRNITINVRTNNTTNITNDLRSINNSFNEINQENDRLRQNTLGLERVFRQVWGQVSQYMRTALTEMKAVDTELITIQKVTNESAEGMKRYADDAYEVASKLGASAHEYLNAVAEFAKAGYGKQSKELGELAITAAKVGDTTQQMANQFLLSVDAAYKYEGSIEKLTAVLDGANEIGNKFPTSVEKIAQGLGKVSPIAAQAHVGIDELTAAIGTITAVTQRTGAEASTALRALFLNIIGDTKTEIEDGAKWTAGEIEGLRDVLRQYAPEVVKAAEATGKLINPMEAIAALADAMDRNLLSEQKLMEMVSDIGGKLRTSQLLALIQNFGKYQDMLTEYRKAAGSAAQEYAIYLDSWEAKTNQLKATWTDFVQRQLGTDKIKELLDTLIKIVDNLENWIPLIGSIGIAIAALEIPRLITQIVRLASVMGGLPGVLGAIAVGFGIVDSAIKQHVSNLKKSAETSIDNAKKQNEEVTAMMQLASQYASAAENSEDFQTASQMMQAALSNEGKEVNNLTEDYKQLMIAKAQAAAVEANTAFSKAGTAFESVYGTGSSDSFFNWMNKRSANVNSKSFRVRGASSFLTGVATSFTKNKAVRSYGRGNELYYGAADNSAGGVAAYYEAVASAIRDIEVEAYRLKEAGNEAAGSNLLNSAFYKELGSVVEYLGESYGTYASARQMANDADLTAANISKYYSHMDKIKAGNMSVEELKEYISALKEDEDLTDSMKNLLVSMVGSVYPQYAQALGIVTDALNKEADAAENVANATDKAKSALGRYKEAMEGADKDDQFKEYKDVYDAVMKAAKRGAYGSNAFQYGIAALVDPKKIEEYKGNWAGLVKYIQESQGALYKSSESMGKGLLDRIYKEGKKTGKGLREIYDDETKKLLASYNKNTGEWQISNDPEDIKKLAGKLGMSAESLVAAGIALGAMDPNADVEGLSKALETILGGGEEKLTAEEQAAQTQLDAATKNADSATTFSTAVASFAEIMAAEATAQDEKDANRNAPPANKPSDDKRGPQYTETGADIMDKHDGVYVHADNRDPNPPTPVVNTGVVFGPTRETIETIEAAIEEAEQQDIAQVAANRARQANGKTSDEPIPVEVVSATTGGTSGSGGINPQKDAVIQTLTDSMFGGASKAADTGSFVQGLATFIGNMMVGASKQMEGSSFASTSIGKFVSDNLVNFGESLIKGTLPGAAGEIVEGISQIQANYGQTWAEAAASSAFTQTVADIGDGVELDVEAITEGATTDLEAVMAIADEIEEENPELVVDADTGKADAMLTALEARLDAITKARTIYISVKYGGVATDGPHDPGASPGLMARPTGDPYFHGGEVLVNDEPGGWNPELIVAGGRAFIANGGDPVVLNLPRGAVIYNADETRSIFNGGSDLLNIPSFADSEGSLATKDYGMSSGRGSKPYTPKKKTTPSSGSGSGGSGSGDSGSMSDDDMLKQLNEYMEQILDAAHDALDDQLEAINAQIYALKYQTEAAEKASALEEARLQLLEAEKNLLDANTERTVRYYNAATGQWEWMADQRKVLQAQEELADSQKNLLEAEYDALTTAWKELKDEIEKALKGEGGPIDINKVLAALGKSAAKGSKSDVKSLISEIFGYTDDPRAYANFDGGGIAHGLGWMPKGNAGAEAVLDSNITNAILNPVTNAAFQGFTDSLTNLFQLAGGSVGLPSSRFGGNISNLYGGNTYIEGVKIGSDMMNRPLSEVLSTLNLYKNV